MRETSGSPATPGVTPDSESKAPVTGARAAADVYVAADSAADDVDSMQGAPLAHASASNSDAPLFARG